MLSYREIPPSARLRPLVDCFWMLQHDGKDAVPQRVIPDSHRELILTWNQPFESFQSGRWHRQLRVSWQARLTARCY
jgi:hypothetical protein